MSQLDSSTLTPPRGTWLTARLYDPFMWLTERSGMADRRRRLVEQASGEVLEIGAGTGLNLRHYPAAVQRLVLTEPEPHMAARLRHRVQTLHVPAEVVQARAEELPFPDASFDTVVGTLVLCTVGDPVRAIAQARRVLRPGGKYLFLEHVRSPDERLAHRQDRWRRRWEACADGCQCNRRTVELLQGGGFAFDELETADWRRVPSLVRPLAFGRATPA